MQSKQRTTGPIAFTLYIDKLRFRQGKSFDLLYPEIALGDLGSNLETTQGILQVQ